MGRMQRSHSADRRPEDQHPEEQELLLAHDCELSGPRLAELRAHLAACRECQARYAKIGETIESFAEAHRQVHGPQLPPRAFSRALLLARLAESSGQDSARAGHWQVYRTGGLVAAGVLFAALLLTALVIPGFRTPAAAGPPVNASMISPANAVAMPNPALTPGATRRAALDDLCATPHEEVVVDVPASLRQQVLREYGIRQAREGDYEIDYLITPGLGGSGSIRNLWPEPYKVPLWNARAKDALEERLHQLVCSGKLDLPTAQRAIATDWIGAYKRYFHGERPLGSSAGL